METTPATQTTPNAEALESRIKIGPIECTPFTLGKAILLEIARSPFIVQKTDAEGKPIENYQPTLQEIAEALWIFVNGDRPDAMDVVENAMRFKKAAWVLASRVADLAQVSRDISAVFAGVNKTMKDSGMEGGDGEKKGMTGSSV